MKKFLAPSLLLFTSCSALIPPHLELYCYTEEDVCPEPDEVQHARDMFADEVQTYDPETNLEVQWYDEGSTLLTIPTSNGPYKVLGFTEDARHVSVSSMRIFFHEMMHVSYFQQFNLGDNNHEEAPGPWTAEDNETIRRVELQFESEGEQ